MGGSGRRGGAGELLLGGGLLEGLRECEKGAREG